MKGIAFMNLVGLCMVSVGVYQHTGSAWLAMAAVGATYCLMPFIKN